MEVEHKATWPGSHTSRAAGGTLHRSSNDSKPTTDHNTLMLDVCSRASLILCLGLLTPPRGWPTSHKRVRQYATTQ